MINSIDTKRLRLIPLQEHHLDTLHAIFTRPEVREYLWDDEIIDKETTASVISTSTALMKSGKGGLWLIQPDAKTFAGFVGLYFFFDEPQAQLLYGLGREFWTMGYATEASRAIIKHAFEKLGFTYLLAAMDEPHAASKRVCERLGMSVNKKAKVNGKETIWYRIENSYS